MHIPYYLEPDDLVDKINRFADKLYRLFDIYDIEHSEILLFDSSVFYDICVSGIEDSINVYDVKGYKLFSSHSVYFPSGKFNSDYAYTNMYITIYVNYPKFTYKQVYRFAHNLMDTIWRNMGNKFIEKIVLLKPMCIPNEQFEDCEDRVVLLEINRRFKIHNIYNINNSIDILVYFKPLMKYFFGEYDSKVNEMIDKIKHGDFHKIFDR